MPEKQAISINRLRNMFLNVIELTMVLRSDIEDIQNDVNQARIDSLITILDSWDKENQSLKNCIATVLKETIGEEVEEIDVRTTENGNEIL